MAARLLLVLSACVWGFGCAEEASERLLTQPAELVSVVVKGTTIRILPARVDILSAAPERDAATLLTAGGAQSVGDFPNSIIYNRMQFIFATARSWNATTGHAFREGDVIYTFFFQAENERQHFRAAHDLHKVADLNCGLPLYQASPGYYVLLQRLTKTFACSMHPHIWAQRAGRCSVCDMQLIETEVYR